MDNKEFARILLCEASILLEGVKLDEYMIKKTKNKYTDDMNDRVRALRRSVNKAKALRNKYDDYDDKDTNGTFEKTHRFDDAFEKYIENSNVDLSKTNDHRDNEFNRHAHATLAAVKRAEKDAGFNYRKPKKVQNESIAVLLTEAALLLNED